MNTEGKEGEGGGGQNHVWILNSVYLGASNNDTRLTAILTSPFNLRLLLNKMPHACN